MKNKYKAGADFERRVAKWYEEQGAEAIRSAGSHGICDVIALFPTHIVLNTLRISGYWSPIEKEIFDWAVTRLRLNGLPYVGRYVWRGNRAEKYKIYFKEVKIE